MRIAHLGSIDSCVINVVLAKVGIEICIISRDSIASGNHVLQFRAFLPTLVNEDTTVDLWSHHQQGH